MISKETFECDRYCGQCCKELVIRVNKSDIERIRKLGYEDEDFLERDLVYRNKFILKRTNDGCIFLKEHKDGRYSCIIYKNRPKTCQHYPFFAKNIIGSCLPNKMYPSAFFKSGRTIK